MRIISLNLWYGEKPDAIREYIAKHVGQTDVFCFQETKGAEAVLDNSISAEDFNLKEMRKNTNEDYSLRTYTRHELEIISTTELLGDFFEAGSALAIELMVNRDPFVIVNIHGAPRPGDKLDTPSRIKQSESIIEFLGSKRDVQKIICGDFNLMPSTYSVEIFENFGYRNLIKDYRIATTRNELAWAKHPNNKQLFADYAFVSEGVGVNQFTVPNVFVSDHLPMILDFDLI